jgi:hypothetical protein
VEAIALTLLQVRPMCYLCCYIYVIWWSHAMPIVLVVCPLHNLHRCLEVAAIALTLLQVGSCVTIVLHICYIGCYSWERTSSLCLWHHLHRCTQVPWGGGHRAHAAAGELL